MEGRGVMQGTANERPLSCLARQEKGRKDRCGEISWAFLKIENTHLLSSSQLEVCRIAKKMKMIVFDMLSTGPEIITSHGLRETG